MVVAVRFLRPYVWGLLAVVACTAVKVLLGALVVSTGPYLFFTIAVVVIAYNYGFGPGVFTVVASTLSPVLLSQWSSIATPGRPEWQRALPFALQALVICYICGVRIRTALDRSAALEAERLARVELVGKSQELRQSEERYRGMIAAVPQIIFVADSDFNFEWINDRWIGLTGMPENASHGRGWLDAVEPDDRDAVALEIADAVSAKHVLNVEVRLRDQDTGSSRWQLARAVPVANHAGGVAQWIGSFTDVHDGKLLMQTMQESNEQLESRVRNRTQELVNVNRELEAANAELEAFCYAVSHDLRTPLRAIDGFSQALSQDFGADLPAEGQAYVERVRSGARRMDELITSLLKLSRISRQELTLSAVNMSDLATSAWTDLEHAHGSQPARLTVQPNLTANADAKLVRIVLDNLLGNALKFTSLEVDPRVEVGAATTERGPSFYVKDNGVGFSMEYAGKLFVPFERLHSPRDYPGSGVGLATVMRCVRKHGGEAWAESTEGGGATFYFTLAPTP
ncbi:MAG: sensor histidine kinase [Fimbriimonadaceae bacterium]